MYFCTVGGTFVFLTSLLLLLKPSCRTEGTTYFFMVAGLAYMFLSKPIYNRLEQAHYDAKRKHKKRTAQKAAAKARKNPIKRVTITIDREN